MKTLKLSIKEISCQTGSMLIIVLIATGLFLVMLLGVIGFSLLQQKLNLKKVAQAQALHIAEAGANYYRWALYHNRNEYCNKEACIGPPNYGPYGPYAYTDSAGKNISGYYELYITPPEVNGSTIIKIKSVGWVSSEPNVKKTLEVKTGMPSWSTYSWLVHDFVNFTSGTNVYGRVHSNTGVKFNDSVAHNLVTSASWNYNDSGTQRFGVFTTSPIPDPAPDAFNPHQNVPDLPEMFKAGRVFPVQPVSFSLLDNYVSTVFNLATSAGMVLPKTSGSRKGYHITLRNDDLVDIKIVTNEGGNCNGKPRHDITAQIDYAIGTSTPANGIIFVKDKVWVDGVVDGNRITIVANKDTGQGADIIINSSLLYTNYNASNAVGLVAQRNIHVGLVSDDNLRIDAALIAKDGWVGRENYDCTSSYKLRTSLATYGTIASKQRPYFVYTNNGYQTRSYNYDNNLTYSPPPHFPTTGEFSFISWDEK